MASVSSRQRCAKGHLRNYKSRYGMNILVIDAQGGGIGKQVIAAIKKNFPGQPVTAVGTNSAATSAMLKAGADEAATGENAAAV